MSLIISIQAKSKRLPNGQESGKPLSSLPYARKLYMHLTRHRYAIKLYRSLTQFTET